MTTQNPKMYSRLSKPFGKSWEEWAAIWCQWCFQEPKETNPAADETGKNCDRKQFNPNVWFLAGTFGGKAERKCTIPTTRAIFFPLIMHEVSFAEDRDLKTEEELRARTKFDINEVDVSDLYAAVDGIKLENLEQYRVESQLFSLELPYDNPSASSTSKTKAISNCYWAFLEPLSPGKHMISFRAAKPKKTFEIEVTYHVTVS
jgi:hypothetical protein